MESSTPELYEPKDARILLVDDEPANLRLFGLILRAAGYHDVTAIQDPRDVLAAYGERRPDLVLLDINMPHLDGYAVMAQLRALRDPLAPPIVVLTAQSSEDFLLRALDAGATDFLSKPVNRRELLARVRNILMVRLANRLMHDQNAVLETMVGQRTRQLRDSRLEVVRVLARASEHRDNETGQHVLRMSHSSAMLAERIGWTPEDCDLILHASPMHDVGKIGIPDDILLKPGPLTEDERQLMQLHTVIGADILAGPGDLLAMARDIAAAHHERWDGAGYPRGLMAFQIPMSARIVAVADVFDALTSARPYKSAWSAADAIDYLVDKAGKQFDPTLVREFVALVPAVVADRQRFAETEPGPPPPSALDSSSIDGCVVTS